MKKTYFILLVLFSSVSLFAQSPWTYGIKAGATNTLPKMFMQWYL